MEVPQSSIGKRLAPGAIRTIRAGYWRKGKVLYQQGIQTHE
jgi:hypothetical protein